MFMFTQYHASCTHIVKPVCSKKTQPKRCDIFCYYGLDLIFYKIGSKCIHTSIILSSSIRTSMLYNMHQYEYLNVYCHHDRVFIDI